MKGWEEGKDEDGQPIDPRFNARRLGERTIDEMLGLCKGLVADGVVNPAEAEYLRAWLRANAEAASIWPGSVLKNRLIAIYADGRIDQEELDDLRELLEAVTGENRTALEQRPPGARLATKLPLDDPLPAIVFPDKLFCFTGKFVYGKRTDCEDEVFRRGGQYQNSPTLKTDYLVIGTLASREWMHTTHGRKIETAMRLREDRRARIAIVDEPHWVRFVEESAPPDKTVQASEEAAARKKFSGEIVAMGIPMVGPSKAATLADYFQNMDRFLGAHRDELEEVPGIGEVIAMSIWEFLVKRKQNP